MDRLKMAMEIANICSKEGDDPFKLLDELTGYVVSVASNAVLEATVQHGMELSKKNTEIKELKGRINELEELNANLVFKEEQLTSELIVLKSKLRRVQMELIGDRGRTDWRGL